MLERPTEKQTKGLTAGCWLRRVRSTTPDIGNSSLLFGINRSSDRRGIFSSQPSPHQGQPDASSPAGSVLPLSMTCLGSLYSPPQCESLGASRVDRDSNRVTDHRLALVPHLAAKNSRGLASFRALWSFPRRPQGIYDDCADTHVLISTY